MESRRPQPRESSPGEDSQHRGLAQLPGSRLPARTALPQVYIHQPARSPMQGGLAGSRDWVLEFAPRSAEEIEPLMGWTSSRDPLVSAPRLHFPSRESAIAFAERQGWPYELREPSFPRFQPKSYADNFKYALATPSLARATDGAAPCRSATAARRGAPQIS